MSDSGSTDAATPDEELVVDGEAIPQYLIGISFDDLFRAREFLTAATRLASTGAMALHDAVIVSKDDSGKTRVQETIDPQPGATALSGGAWAGLFGLLLGGPVGWIAGTAIGAGAGALTAKVVDVGISDEWVDWFREEIEPGRVLVALLASEVDTDQLVVEAGRFTGAELVYSNLGDQALERIKSALRQVSFERS